MAESTRYETLTAAMQAGDELAEAEMRYEMLDEVFRDAAPRERKSLSVELNSLMQKITTLRALQEKHGVTPPPIEPDPRWGKIVPFDAERFAHHTKKSS